MNEWLNFEIFNKIDDLNLNLVSFAIYVVSDQARNILGNTAVGI